MKKQAQPTAAHTPAAQAASGARGVGAKVIQSVKPTSGGRSAAFKVGRSVGRVALPVGAAAALGYGAYRGAKALKGKKKEETKAAMAGFFDELMKIKGAA